MRTIFMSFRSSKKLLMQRDGEGKVVVDPLPEIRLFLFQKENELLEIVQANGGGHEPQSRKLRI
jgi:hypothetical protein